MKEDNLKTVSKMPSFVPPLTVFLDERQYETIKFVCRLKLISVEDYVSSLIAREVDDLETSLQGILEEEAGQYGI